jgi:hypothetical protein
MQFWTEAREALGIDDKSTESAAGGPAGNVAGGAGDVGDGTDSSGFGDFFLLASNAISPPATTTPAIIAPVLGP